MKTKLSLILVFSLAASLALGAATVRIVQTNAAGDSVMLIDPVTNKVVGEIKALEPDVLIPMHCSGLNFVQEATAQMGDKVLVTTTGSRLTFGI